MENIALPKNTKFEKTKEANESIAIVEPLYPGYGMTLGNSLRRVLLSSLPGAAVVGVKIKGANHEFMPLNGIKEDVLEIVLNIKQLRLKMFSDEEIRLELKAKGKKQVLAKDIEKNSEVKITNPDLVIANLTEAKSELNIEIFVRAGRGYKMTEGKKRENKEISYIEIDSIFSPVLAVSLKVENTRVGKMTNWDSLSIKIKTDGTIDSQEAFTQAVEILVQQYQALLPRDEKIEEQLPEESDNEALEEEKKEKKSKK
jgi:DNA-directed RNA polymerase subunit alpha